MTKFAFWMKEQIKAHDNLDGVQLQKLEAKIIDDYKEGNLSHYEYETLIGVNNLFMQDRRLKSQNEHAPL